MKQRSVLKVKKEKVSVFKLSARAKDLPATQGMLDLVRSELKADNRELRSEMSAGFKEVDARFNGVDARFNKIDARFNEVDARFNKIDARFSEVDARFDRMEARFDRVDANIHHMSSEIFRMSALMEEQNAKNNVVLEALTGLALRQTRVETRVDNVESLVRSIALGRTKT
jgi:chromosome segregation ATPase